MTGVENKRIGRASQWRLIVAEVQPPKDVEWPKRFSWLGTFRDPKVEIPRVLGGVETRETAAKPWWVMNRVRPTTPAENNRNGCG